MFLKVTQTNFSPQIGRDPFFVNQSMSRKGDCWDNAVAESFFKTLKVERVYRNKYDSRRIAENDVFWWIEAWYNRKRKHSKLGMLSIQEFEQLNKTGKIAA